VISSVSSPAMAQERASQNCGLRWRLYCGPFPSGPRAARQETGTPARRARTRGKLSAEGRRRIAEAQRKRWAVAEAEVSSRSAQALQDVRSGKKGHRHSDEEVLGGTAESRVRT